MTSSRASSTSAHRRPMAAGSRRLPGAALRVIVAEDSKLIRELLSAELTRRRIRVTGQARTISELLHLIAANPPDLIVLDIRMPRANPHARPEYLGLEAAQQIRREHPGIAILVLSGHDVVEWAAQIASLGRGAGYLLKDKVSDLDALVKVLREVADGEVRIDPALVDKLLTGKQLDDPIRRLTPLELSILRLMAEGMSDAAIARLLHIREAATRSSARTVYRKLGLPADHHAGSRDLAAHQRVPTLLAFLRLGAG